MIYVYKIKHIPATDTKGARVKVTRLNDQESRTIPFMHDAEDVVRKTIKWTFGEEKAEQLQLICHLNAAESLYAIHHP